MNGDQNKPDLREEPAGRLSLGRPPLEKATGRHDAASAPRPKWRRPLLLGLLVLAVAGLAAIALRPHGARPPHGHRMGGGPVPVVTAPARKGDVDITLTGLGTVTPLATVTVKTQINGQLTQIAFREGQSVHAGDFLAQIDPRPYQAQLDQELGALERDKALLQEAKLDLARYNTLLAQDSIAAQQRDLQASLVKQYQGAVISDQAQIDNARLNLIYCHIVSPITGRVGLRLVDQGNFVQTTDANGIVVITQLQPITVIFVLPEDDLPAILRRLHAGATLQVQAWDRAETTRLATGRLETVDNQIDTATGTVKLRAIFDNPDESLFPNQFVNAHLLVDVLHGATVVPTAAIQRGAPGTFVYLVKADHTVAVRPVTLGPVSGDTVAVKAGLQPGDGVVVDGADKLRDGAAVRLAADGGAAHR